MSKSSLFCQVQWWVSRVSSLDSHISDTRSQGCTELPSLVKCVNYRNIVIQYAIKLGWWRLHDVLECMLEAIFTVMVNTTASLRAADKHPKGLLLTLGQSWQSWPATTHIEPSLEGASVQTRVSARSPGDILCMVLGFRTILAESVA